MDVKEEVRRYLEEDAEERRLADALGEDTRLCAAWFACENSGGAFIGGLAGSDMALCTRPECHTGPHLCCASRPGVDGWCISEIDSKD